MLFPCSCHAWLSGWVQNAFSPDVSHALPCFSHALAMPGWPDGCRMHSRLMFASSPIASSPIFASSPNFQRIRVFPPLSLIFPSSVPHLSLFCTSSVHFQSYSRLPSSFPLLSLIFPASVPHLPTFHRIRVFPHLSPFCPSPVHFPSFSRLVFSSSFPHLSFIFPSSVPHLSPFCPSSVHFPADSCLPSSFPHLSLFCPSSSPLLSLICPFSITFASLLICVNRASQRESGLSA